MKYYVNKNAGSVVAIMNEETERKPLYLSVSEYILGRFLKDYDWRCVESDFRGALRTIIVSIAQNEMPHQIVGIAKCSPDDVFEQHIGKDLARARCLNEYYYRMCNIIEKTQKLLSDMGAHLESQLDKSIDTTNYWADVSDALEGI